MRIDYISSRVRIVFYPKDYIVRVEGLFEDGAWGTYWETNEMSNDFAHVEAHERAASLARKLDILDNYRKDER